MKSYVYLLLFIAMALIVMEGVHGACTTPTENSSPSYASSTNWCTGNYNNVTINFGANGINIELNNSYDVGKDTAGSKGSVGGWNNVNLTNGFITNFEQGFRDSGGKNNTVMNMNFYNCSTGVNMWSDNDTLNNITVIWTKDTSTSTFGVSVLNPDTKIINSKFYSMRNGVQYASGVLRGLFTNSLINNTYAEAMIIANSKDIIINYANIDTTYNNTGLRTTNATNIIINYVNFTNIGRASIGVSCINCTITNNRIINSGHGGITVLDSIATVRSENTTIANNFVSGFTTNYLEPTGCIDLGTGTGIKIINNTCFNITNNNTQDVKGINLYGAQEDQSNNLIENNTVNISQYCIWQTGSNNTYKNNSFQGCSKYLAQITTSGASASIEYSNWINNTYFDSSNIFWIYLPDKVNITFDDNIKNTWFNYSAGGSVFFNYTGHATFSMQNRTWIFKNMSPYDIKLNGSFIASDATSFTVNVGINDNLQVLDGGCDIIPYNNTRIGFSSGIIPCLPSTNVSGTIVKNTSINITPNFAMNITLGSLIGFFPYNDIYNVSTSSVLSSNVDNYSLSLSPGQQIIVGNFTSLSYSLSGLTSIKSIGTYNLTLNITDPDGIYYNSSFFVWNPDGSLFSSNTTASLNSLNVLTFTNGGRYSSRFFINTSKGLAVDSGIQFIQVTGGASCGSNDATRTLIVTSLTVLIVVFLIWMWFTIIGFSLETAAVGFIVISIAAALVANIINILVVSCP